MDMQEIIKKHNIHDGVCDTKLEIKIDKLVHLGVALGLLKGAKIGRFLRSHPIEGM